MHWLWRIPSRDLWFKKKAVYVQPEEPGVPENATADNARKPRRMPMSFKMSQFTQYREAHRPSDP